MEAERRQVTVRFADMASFTSFSERSGEEAAYTLIRSLSQNYRGRGRSLSDFHRSIGANDRISVDVFDTLLLRKAKSERRRFYAAAKRSIELGHFPALIKPEVISRARAEAQTLAYRALNVAGQGGEVRLEDICRRQLSILGLSVDLAPVLIRAELETEKDSLFVDRYLVESLLARRRQGIRVIAISDTTLSSDELKTLITMVVGSEVFDAIYTSADLGATKRSGELFRVVAKLEQVDLSAIWHVGDDIISDVQMATGVGAHAMHRPRSKTHVIRRRVDAVWFEAKRQVAQHGIKKVEHVDQSENSFGRLVMGPILAEYCVRLWLYLSAIAPERQAIALFCARGGLNLHVVFEHFLARAGLDLDIPRRDLMVSRLIAARSSLLREKDAAAPILARDFVTATVGQAACALTQMNIQLGPEWDAPFTPDLFWQMFNSSSESAVALKDEVRKQDELFKCHLAQNTQQAKTIVLCDTGLYGSIQRMLMSGSPDRTWECVLLARCNYTGLSAPHFRKTAGLLVERDFYAPYDRRSVILRYWNVMEVLLEPPLPTAKTFYRLPDGRVASNLEIDDWRSLLAPAGPPMLVAALEYVVDLPRSNWFSHIITDADCAWRRLKRSIIFPSQADVRLLAANKTRSRDFGTTKTVSILNDPNGKRGFGGYRQIRSALWREGAIVNIYGPWAPAILRAFEVAYSLRGIHRSLRVR